MSGSYTIDREIGGGGMSRVFAATDIALDRSVVIKVLEPDLVAGVNVERFRREIQVAAKLQHAYIVPLLSAGVTDVLPYYTMPLVEGESLRVVLRTRGALPIPEAVRLLRDIAEALSYAHEHGIVHRDIKPENVLVTDYHAVVTDFGVAKALSAATSGDGRLTSVGVAIGTPAYMAPEQAVG
ncbi:MAG: serine/threonine protein kinase, partial [Gemmatimonadota bacterium]|nr:serine/threonine protein kinase [Gemmatimonadota bacterium]